MGKKIRRILLLFLLAVFFFSAGYIAFTLYGYEEEKRFYTDTAQQYMLLEEKENRKENTSSEPEGEIEAVPVSIDFESLRAVNSDIIGWIYCEDTVINYPVLQGADNDVYLHHTYEGNYSGAGSIFADAANRPDFADSNTIIYGHHMKNKTMFATLENWMDQDYYEEHPVMWLLTPKQNYKIVLFSGYVTSAYSDTYTIFTGPCDEFNDYLKGCVEQSEFKTDIELDEDGYYVVLSTCAYVFDNARYVLHGILIPWR
ncbi:MAG: class B sortase [Lachnospiraceae bacterium]|nr:class B sortase [Lachnospiraceae bacterium]